MPGGGGGGGGEELSAFSSYAAQRRERRRQGHHGYVGPGIEQGDKTGKTKARATSPLSAVMNGLASGIDDLVLVHTTVEGRDVVEVLVDRVGDMTGRWGAR